MTRFREYLIKNIYGLGWETFSQRVFTAECPGRRTVAAHVLWIREMTFLSFDFKMKWIW